LHWRTSSFGRASLKLGVATANQIACARPPGGRRWDVDIRGTARNQCAFRGAPIARRRARFALEQLAARSYGSTGNHCRLAPLASTLLIGSIVVAPTPAAAVACLLAQPDQYQHSRARSGDHLRQYRAAHQSRDAFFIGRGLELSRVRLAVGQAARESEKRKERCAGQYPHRLSPSSFAVISVGEYSSERGSQKKRAAARRPSIHEKRVALSRAGATSFHR
jgi:hypothetical protein